jgi:hypothetical protein
MPIQGNIIGVVCNPDERPLVQEFFELFKTPWEFYQPERHYDVVLSTQLSLDEIRAKLLIVYNSSSELTREGVYLEYQGATFPVYGAVKVFKSANEALVRLHGTDEAVVMESARHPMRVLHVGYNIFREVDYLLTSGQPERNALSPTVDVHIAMLRNWILSSGIPVVEIPPTPAGHDFMACVTHDVDFIRIRDHKFDHTALGFAYRASIGSIRDWANGKMSRTKCLANLKALLSLPAVYAGLSKDFWAEDFERFLELEEDVKATYFFIPFKDTPGENVANRHPNRRAAAYDVASERPLLQKLLQRGHEVGVHGLDAWHSAEKGHDERRKIELAADRSADGIRMHWLCFGQSSPQTLEQAGFQYDSTMGYNSAVGYRAGTTQAFKPTGVQRLLELPLHLQDTALFYPGNMELSEDEAWNVCQTLLDNARKHGGVLTLLWHTRSLAPERQWGDIYARLLDELRRRRAWFGTASQVIEWFRIRRAACFRDAQITDNGLRVTMQQAVAGHSSLTLRVHLPQTPTSSPTFTDIPWTGEPLLDIPLRELEAVWRAS